MLSQPCMLIAAVYDQFILHTGESACGNGRVDIIAGFSNTILYNGLLWRTYHIMETQ